jgi:hypothetical protein
LNGVFGRPTYSIYDDMLDIGSNPQVREAVGHVDHGLPPDVFIKQATNASETFWVKTHDAPVDDGKAIYVVRDGRSAVVSYFHWIKRYLTDSDVSLRDVVLGEVEYGSWSEHIQGWSPATRPNTLFLTYEQVIAPDAGTISLISEFLGVDPLPMGSVPSFDDLNAREPSFFRAGSDAKNITELAGDELELFWWLHGGAMLELDFVQEVPESASPSRSRQLFLDAFSQTKSELKEHIGELSARLEAAGAERAAGEAEFRRQIEELRARLDTTHAEFDATKVELATVSERLSLIETALTERSAEVELLHRRLSVLGRSRWLKIGHKLKLSRRLRQIEPYL